MKIIYFTVTPLDSGLNGGNLCCRNHVRRLAEDPSIDLVVVAAPSLISAAGTQAFLQEVGVEHLVKPISDQNLYPEVLTLGGTLKFGWQVLTHFPWELKSLNQQEIDEAVRWATRRWRPDVVVIDYLFSALFCPSVLHSDTRTAIVTLNREAEFHRQMIDLGLIKQAWPFAQIGHRRAELFERNVYGSADRVIAISQNDIPPYAANKSECISPYLDPNDVGWSFNPSTANDVFFVGNIAHYPNRLAIEFIAERLAPAVAARRQDIQFKIVGAGAAQVPPEWIDPQIEYLGFGSQELVQQLFQTAGLFICPVENTFGVKFKVLEALSYRTPQVVSAETKQGIPYIPSVPVIDLADPEACAELICSLAGDQAALEALHRSIATEAEQFEESQRGVWSRALSAGSPVD